MVALRRRDLRLAAMMRWIYILLAASSFARAADPVFVAPTTNELIALKLPPVTNVRISALLGGYALTNGVNGGPFILVDTNGLSLDFVDVFPSTVSTKYWLRLVAPTSGVTGTGTDNRIAVWSGSTTLAEDVNFQWDSSLSAMSIGDVPATGISLFINRSGATTVASEGLDILNAATSSTASINKFGMAISSTGTWNGTSANNYGLYIGGVSGGTVNWSIYNNNAAAVYLGSGAITSSGAATWTGLHSFDVGLNLRSTDIYSVPPATSLNGTLKYNAAGDFRSLATMTLGKENATDGNDAGYWAVNTRPNGGSVTERLRVTSAGVVNVPNLTVTKPVFTDASKNLVSTGTVQPANGGLGQDMSGGARYSFPYLDEATAFILLGPNTTTTKKFLRMTGTGAAGDTPAWDTIAYSDLPIQTLSSQYTTAGNVGAAITVLMTNTIPAGKLAANGDMLKIRICAQAFGVSNSKTLTIYLLGNNIQSEVVPSPLPSLFVVDIEAIRVNSTTARYTMNYHSSLVGASVAVSDITATMSNALGIGCTGLGTSDNDIVQYTMTIIYYAAP